MNKHLQHLSSAVVIVSLVKFILDGVTITIGGTPMDFGHVDSATYIAILSPVLAAHSYTKVRGEPKGDK